MHCALNLTVTRSYRNQAYQDTHTHTENSLPNMSSIIISFQGLLWPTGFGWACWYGRPLGWGFIAWWKIPCSIDFKRIRNRKWAASEQLASKRLKPICESMIFFMIWSHFHIGSSLLRSHFLKRLKRGDFTIFSHRGMEGLVHGLRLASAYGRFWTISLNIIQWFSEMPPTKITHIF